MSESAEPFVPPRHELPALREAAAACRGCHLWEHATQTVFGEGSADAEVVLLGEQPGDQEDRQGRPFVGPAGRVLAEALESAGIDPGRAYVTNAVKHFKWEARGKRRIHKTPNDIEISACKPWFAAELDALTPRILVLLGATAGKSVFGKDFRVTKERGQLREGPRGIPTLPTVHPSSVLRARDDREAAMAALVEDLAVAARVLDESPAPS